MNQADRDRFDALVEAVLDALPPAIHELLEEAPLIVGDGPSRDLLRSVGMADCEDDVLCGLFSGASLTDRSFTEGIDMPETIHLFREGIVEIAGGWERRRDEETGEWIGGEEAVAEEIRITLLHEIGHHFGLDEDDLDRLGYA